jgi:hypothetical protein
MLKIRTQNRTKLVNCAGVYIDDSPGEDFPNYCIYGIVYGNGGHVILGYYYTLDESLKVLDNLENNDAAVYHMPKTS